MSDEVTTPTSRIGAGLALSGGGFRATLMHLGALWRMNELGLLPTLKQVTSVSGGSIAAAYLGYRWRELVFVDDVAGNFADTVAAPLQRFCGKSLDVGAIAKGKLKPFKTAADYAARAYDDELFHGATLHDLPDDSADQGPRFIIYATNMQSGVSFRFSRPYMADYRIGVNRNTGSVRIADAVAASSAFPPVMTPKVLKTNPADWEQDEVPERRGDLWANEDFRKKIYLTDGGVYDNMALEAASRRCDPLYVSAAGAPFDASPLSWTSTKTEAGVALRVTGILTEQIRALRRRMLMRGYIDDGVGGAYWNIASKISAYDLADAIVADSPATQRQQTIRTRLNAFSAQEQGELINWGFALADTAIRRWAEPQPAGTWAWPVPTHPL